MNDLLRPSLYSAYHKIEAVRKEGERILLMCWPICESGDFLGKDVPLPPLEHNDILCAYQGRMGLQWSSNLQYKR